MLNFKKILLFAFLLVFSFGSMAATMSFNAEKASAITSVVMNNPTPNSTMTKKEERKLKRHERLLKKIEKIRAGDKSHVAAILLCFFLGGLGIHRFYLGYTWQGVVQLLTLGGLGIWVLIDFIRIIIKDLKPKDGDYK